MSHLAVMSCRPGAVRWTAPEILSGKESLAAFAISTQSDTYSFGSVILQVLMGKIPAREVAILRKVIFKEETHLCSDDDCVTDRLTEFYNLLSYRSHRSLCRRSA
ncbi:hypothetical protein DFJ58DRAFT_21716 [Suillus subalutaceus]|uniref:uncharacterized protein n=1 Tax=Suillus subalutaceus TaxID=48586 RepID=UPI001B866629|nr:uncharacterized protein DFJ58DRAFT_21716 [Suillus subalutaceus]KAG1870693.1 hypothetical protein DFJ58DRAFT_21716 [Suillus subalutaceus]